MKARVKKTSPATCRAIVLHEDPDPICSGDIVMLPEGALAAVEKIVGTDAYVIEWTKQIGRGPWIFPVSELVPVS